MTVRVTQKMRKRIDAMKNKRELVTDDSHKDIHKRGFTYESPDNGKTIYRTEYCDVSGVRIDKPDQLEFEFDEFKADAQYQAGYSDAMAFMEDRGRKISQVATLLGEAGAYAAASASLLGEVTEGINKLRDNN